MPEPEQNKAGLSRQCSVLVSQSAVPGVRVSGDSVETFASHQAEAVNARVPTLYAALQFHQSLEYEAR